MKYISTRGGSPPISFEEAVLTGLAPDGGLFVPETIPSLPENWKDEWKSLSFSDLAMKILPLFVDENEIASNDLSQLVHKSYSTFRHPHVTPLVPLEENANKRTYILELFHGPTFAFKDVALQFLGNLFEYFLQRKNVGKSGRDRKTLTIVGATSGDTGSAAIYGLRNKTDVSVFILHPKGKVSPIQEAQMTTVQDPNVFNLAVKGSFDDCQDIVKTLFADKEFNSKYHVGAVNSINWARILAQTVYYFWAYFRYHERNQPGSSEIQFVVPTGNFGDILAGWYASRMGLPMQKLVCATNENDILARFWNTGKYAKSVNGKSVTGVVKETLSPAMDILVSSNFERFLWHLICEQDTAGDAKKAGIVITKLMQELKENGSFDVSRHVYEASRNEIHAERVSDLETGETIRKAFTGAYGNTPYVSDPHTAVALTAAQRVKAGPQVQIVLATAHPAKFSEAVEGSLSDVKEFNFERDVLPKEFKGLLEKERRVINIDGADAELTKKVIIESLRVKD